MLELCAWVCWGWYNIDSLNFCCCLILLLIDLLLSLG